MSENGSTLLSGEWKNGQLDSISVCYPRLIAFIWSFSPVPTIQTPIVQSLKACLNASGIHRLYDFYKYRTDSLIFKEEQKVFVVTEEASGVLVDEAHDEGEVVDQQQRGDGRQRRQRAHLQLEHARRLRALARHHCQHVAQILVLRLTIAVRPHEHVLRGETGVVHRRRARQHALDALQVERLRRTGRVSSDAGVAGITGIAGRASIGCAGNYA